MNKLIPFLAAVFLTAGCGNNPSQTPSDQSTSSNTTSNATQTAPGTNGHTAPANSGP